MTPSAPLFCRSLLVLFVLLVQMGFSAQAQTRREFLKVEQISIENGLSQNSSQAILQDSEGYLWVGTQDGLNRHNAYEITIFRSKRDDTTAICDNNISSLLEDSKGLIWIGTTRGVSVFNRKTQKFRSFFRNANDPKSLIASEVKCLAEDKNGNIWIGTSMGLSRFDRKTETFQNFLHDENNPASLPANDVTCLLPDGDNLWIGTNGGGLARYGLQNQAFEIFKPIEGDTTSVSSLSIPCLCKDKDGKIWVGGNGLQYYDPANNAFLYHIRRNIRFTRVVEWKESELMVATAGGTILRVPKAEKETFVAQDLKYDVGQIVYQLYVDRAGILWIGNQNSGVLYHDEQMNRFKHYIYQEKNPESLTAPVVWHMSKDTEGFIWAATENGLTRIDPKSNQYWQYYANVEQPRPNELQGNNLTTTLIDRDGTLWVGAMGAGLHRLESISADGKKLTFTVFRADRNNPNSLATNQFLLMRQVANGDIWIGGFNGLTRLVKDANNPKQVTFEKYIHNPDDPNSMPARHVWGLFEDSEGTLWIGTNSGLLRTERDSEGKILRFIHYKHDPNDDTTVSHEEVRAIAEDSKGNFWLGTSNGLNLFDRKTGKVKHLGLEYEQANYSIYGILVDKSDNLWISTNNGIMKYLANPAANQARFIVFNVKDGLQSNEFNSGSYHLAADGEMFFGGINGLNSFYPEKIVPNPYKPPVVFTDFKIFNKSVEISREGQETPLLAHISQTEEIILTHEDKVFSFEFAALNYRLPEKNQYFYKMEGFDEDWVEAGNRRFAQYSNMPAGSYVFRVRAVNNDGIGDEKGIAIRVIIKPPFWKTWWFISLSVITVIGLTFAIYANRVRSIQNQKRKLEQQVAERTAEIASQNLRLEAQKGEIERSYDNIRILSEIGQKITAILDLDTVISTVYGYVNQLTDASAFGIGIYNHEGRRLEFRGFMEKGERVPDSYDELREDNLLSVWCFKTGREVFINDVEKEIHQYAKNLVLPTVGDRYNSIIYLPLTAEGKNIGVITVQSQKVNAYSHNDLTILRTLASYISIALENASNFQRLAEANEIIKSKNQAILSSIRYGETIQQAILPDEKVFARHFADHFILFMPQAMVSGDFYWCLRAHNKIFVAAVDCTGHGVPGAFMSMIGNALLHEIITLKSVIEPALILEELHKDVRDALHQDDEQNSDGMDVCLCVFDEEWRDGRRKVVFAGAKRPLFIYKDDKLIEIKGSRKSIGGRQKDEKSFEQRELFLEAGTILYLTTDGYVDQHNQHRTKFGTLRFKEFIDANAHRSLLVQRELLIEELIEHMGQEEQRDDITIIGIKL